ncbi:TetR/AcrR family transcriptional regulator [Cryptobacterium curtum]
MARPKNDILRNAIFEKATYLFTSVGYKRTSYAVIADELSIQRALVQYYVPIKDELAKRFLKSELARALQAWNFSEADLLERADRILAVLATFFGLFTQDAGRACFLKDILENRTLCYATMPLDAAWIARLLIGNKSLSQDDTHAILKTTFIGLGGFYELTYDHLTKEDTWQATDVAKALSLVVEYAISQLEHLTGKTRLLSLAIDLDNDALTNALTRIE